MNDVMSYNAYEIEHYNAKRNSLTGSFAIAKDNDDAEFVVLRKSDFNNMAFCIGRLQECIRIERNKHSYDISDLKSQLNARAEKAEKEAQEKVDLITAERDRLADLNENLKRICRERANADKGLRPKKQHSGYVVERAEQAVRVTYNGKKRFETPVWRCSVSTPISNTMPAAQAEFMALEAIKGGVLDFKGRYYTDIKMRTDTKSQYWTVIVEVESTEPPKASCN